MVRARKVAGGGLASHLEAEILRCRTYGHAWEEFFPDDLGTPLYGWRLSLRCTRCTTSRHDIINRNGSVEGRRYIYPDAYHLDKREVPTRDELRLAILVTLREKLAQSGALGKGAA